MYFKDLDAYHYGIPLQLPDVVSIGWLSRAAEFRTGDIPADALPSLEQLLSSHRVNQMRGNHICEFCSKAPLPYITRSGNQIMLGSAELWIPSVDKAMIYAAPDLVCHYITEHRYLPPQSFIDAVIATRDSEDWDVNGECQKRLDAAYRS